MKIAIDSVCIEQNKRTGLHSYLMSILSNLSKVAPQNEYRLYFKNLIPSYEFLDKPLFRPKLLRKPSVLFWTKKPLWNTFCVPRELLVNKVDIFFSPDYTLPFFWFPVKSIVGIHDISYETHSEWFAPEFLKTIRHRSRESAKKATLIITNSEFCKSEIVKHYGVSERKVFVVYPGISRHFEPNGASGRKYSMKKPFILSVGNLYPRRNAPGLIKAFESIALKLKDYQLLIIGQDQNYGQESVRKLIIEVNQALGSERIIYKEFVSDSELGYFFRNADLFINLTNYEGFGCYSMLEAMIYGCPVIAVKTSSMPELIGDTGIYTSHDNIREIGNAIYNTIKDENLRKRLSKAASERIKRFSTENMAKQFIEACNYVCNN